MRHIIKYPKYPKIKVMILDDQITCLNVIKKILFEASIFNPLNLKFLNNPFEALKLAMHDLSFNLLITDLCMPGINGDILIKSLKGVNPKLKTLLFTASKISLDDEIFKNVKDGADIIIEKINDEEKNVFIKALDTLCKTVE